MDIKNFLALKTLQKGRSTFQLGCRTMLSFIHGRKITLVLQVFGIFFNKSCPSNVRTLILFGNPGSNFPRYLIKSRILFKMLKLVHLPYKTVINSLIVIFFE